MTTEKDKLDWSKQIRNRKEPATRLSLETAWGLIRESRKPSSYPASLISANQMDLEVVPIYTLLAHYNI